MENREDHVSPRPKNDLSASPEVGRSQDLPDTFRNKLFQRPVFLRRGALFIGLTVLVIAIIFSSSIIFLKVFMRIGPLKQWSFQTKSGIIAFSPVVSNGLVYVVSQGGSGRPILYALDALSGGEKWYFQIEGSFVPFSPAVANGLVYVVSDSLISGEDIVYALDASSGRQRWSFHTEDVLSASSPPTVTGKLVYILSASGILYALDTLTGTKLWVEHVGNNDRFSPIVVSGLVYVVSNNLATEDSTVYALNAISGQRKWLYQAKTFATAPLVAASGSVYLGTKYGTLYALDAASGEKEWSYSVGSSIDSSPTISNGVVYVGSDSGYFYALDAKSGHQKWFVYFRESIKISPIVINHIAYVIIPNDTLYALDLLSGHKRWSSRGSFFGFQAKPTMASSIVYIGIEGGTLYAVDGVSGNEEWSYQTNAKLSFSPTVANNIVFVGGLNALDAIQPPVSTPS